MRLRELALGRFGHFAEARLDLSGPAGLHILCGRNEAGKTTILRAISDLLFGIEARSPYAFRYDYSELSLGAEIEAADGRRLRFRRRKGRQNTLLDADGATLPDATLNPYLGGGADRELFHGLFGLDHARLRQGGDDILAARGALGEMLFEAGAGLTGLRGIVQGIEQRANELFSARRVGTKPFYLALDRFKEARRRQHEAQIGTDAWRRLEAELDGTRQRLAAVRTELREIEAERSRTERRRRTLPPATALAAVEAELAATEGASVLSEEDARAHAGALEAARRSAEGRERCALAAERLRADLGALSVRDDVLAVADRIRALAEQRGAIREQRADLPRREAELRQLREQIADLLRRIGSDLPAERAREAVPPQPLLTELRALIVENGRLAEREAAADEQRQRAEGEARRLAALLDRLGPEQDAAALIAALEEARARGGIEERLAETEAELDRLLARRDRGLAALGLWRGDLEALARAPVPDEPTVQRHEALLAEAETAAARQMEQVRTLAEERDQVALEIAAVERGGEVPDAEAVRRARAHRDVGWTLLRGMLGGRKPDPWDVEAFSADQDPADAYEAAVHAADQVADRKEAEASRVARHGELKARRDLLERRLAGSEAVAAQRAAELSARREAWEELWRGIGIMPLPPREMLVWLARRAALLRDHEACEDAASRLTRLRADHDALAAAVGAALAGLGQDVPADNPLGLLLRWAAGCAERLRAVAAERRTLSDRIAEQRAEREAARRLVEQATALRGIWSERWRGVMASLGRAPNALPEAVEASLGAFEELDRRLVQTGELAHRVARMAENVAAFETALDGLLESLALPARGGDPTDVADGLARALDEALRVAALREELGRRLHSAEAEVAQHEAEAREAAAVLERLRRAAAVPDDAALAIIVAASVRRRELQDRRRTLAGDLLALGDGLPLEQLRAEAAEADPDRLAAALPELAARQEVLQHEGTELGGRLADLERDRAELERGRGAERHAQEAQEALAALRSVAEDYLRLRAAGTLLRRAVDRYREDQQGPLLRRAGALFATLTCDAFSGLEVAYDERDQPVLMGRRTAGGTVGVEGMSEGTRDQLFLALRLAAVERYATEAEPLPFVADDLLVNFDDVRAGAAFAVLGALSERVQVIFLTHHPHLCGVAAEHLGQSRLAVHALDDL
ncbi:ATP-binding protein [Arenibaculum pallidiluteum]|uniref:ATP-binding protein n=1 Tax=Arenibaculum pallidiluteum TaxID=2812559 RepID=UPI001A976342|nr:YhaN family protein [Arenibaculum pallidiluteum]